MRIRLLLYLMLLIQMQSVVSAGEKRSGISDLNKMGGTIRCGYIQWWEFDDFKVDGLTLREAIALFRENSGPEDDPSDRVNVIVKWSQLSDVQKNAKIYMDGTGHKTSDVIHVLAMTLGLGYKIEEYAVVIGSLENYPLPETKSTTLGPMLESIRTEPKILIRYVEE